MKKQRPLNRALPIVASSLGDKFGVEVVVAGNTAFTDGKRVCLPAFDPDDEKMKELAYGYLAHEAGGHIRHTDFSVVPNKGSNPIRHGMLNSIEDVRVELALWEDFPGTRRQVFNVIEHLHQGDGFRAPQADAHPAKLLDAYVLIKLRHDLQGMHFLADELAKTEILIQNTFPRGAIIRLNAMLGQVVKAESTRDALFLTDEILAMLKEEEEKAREETMQQQSPDQENAQSDPNDANSTSSQGQGGGTGQSQQGPNGDAANDSDDQAHQGQGNGAGGDGKQDQDGCGSDQSGQQAGDVSGSSKSGSGSKDNDGCDAAAKADALAQALTASVDDVQHEDAFTKVGQMISQGAAQVPPTYRVPTMPKPERAAVSYGNNDRLSVVRCTSNKVRAQLHGLVQASQLRRPITKKQGQRIDTARMTRVIAGDSRIFLQRDKKVAPNAAVHLLVDRSMSMKSLNNQGRSRLDVALDAALALSLALEGISGVNSGVSAFPGNTGSADLVTVLKPHGSSVRANAKNFNITAVGYTPMAEGMWFAASQLLRQREERKLLMVVTDGEPDNSDAVRQIVARCEESDIEVIGIGIQVQSVMKLFRQYVVIQDAAELRSSLFEITKAALIAA